MILASASARRAELLQAAGINFRQSAVPHEEAIDELYLAALKHQDSLTAAKTAIRSVAEDKYRAAQEYLRQEDSILTADTIVFFEGEILGKPLDMSEARQMIRMIAGQEHQVLTAVCLGMAGEYESFVVESSVRFHPYDHDPVRLERYFLSGRALQYAGAYGIQDPDFPLVADLTGSLTNVIGLPMEETLKRIERLISP